MKELTRSETPPDLAALNVFILGDVKLVGGAALILQGIGNRPTADINAGYADSQTIHAVVADMAADYDLAPAGRDYYLIVVNDALDAALTRIPESTRIRQIAQDRETAAPVQSCCHVSDTQPPKSPPATR